VQAALAGVVVVMVVVVAEGGFGVFGSVYKKVVVHIVVVLDGIVGQSRNVFF